MARGLDVVASQPIRGNILYLRNIGGHVHDLSGGFGRVIPVGQSESIPERRRPGRPRRIAGAIAGA
jgi:hypothetical protein